MTKTERQERRNFFFDYFEERISFVENNCLGRIEGLILTCCYIDSLAGFRYGGASSKKRFRQFILSYSGLEHIWTKISLPFLKRHLELKNHDFYKPFIEFIEKKLGVQRRKYDDLSYNPDIDSQKLLEKAIGMFDDRYLLQMRGELTEFDYISILWKDYRNSAVHETTSKKDEAHPLSEKAEPFYVNYTIIHDDKTKHEETRFGIPPVFILKTLKTCLKNFKDECEKVDIDLLELKGAKDDLKSQSRKTKEDEQDDIGYPRLITKPARFLLSDADYFLRQARMCQENFAKTKDASYLKLESSYSRICILICVVFLEGLVNNVLKDFQVIVDHQIPDSLKRKCGLDEMEVSKAPLEDKIYLIPYLCDESPRFEHEFFKKGSKEFQELRELIRIRNSYVHPRPVRRKVDLEITPDRWFLVDDQFPQNFWPLTKIPKDIYIFRHRDAAKAKSIIDNIFSKLDNFLQGRLTKDNWLERESIEFAPSKNE